MEGTYSRQGAYSGQGAYFFLEKQPNVQDETLIRHEPPLIRTLTAQ